jgi:WD repeat-containing protein 19
VNILTTTVIEATKANLKEIAYNWACVLVRPEYRQQITEKYKTRIEQIARRPVAGQTEVEKTPCPFCNDPVAAYDLDCQTCQNTIPYCVASGKHVLKD